MEQTTILFILFRGTNARKDLLVEVFNSHLGRSGRVSNLLCEINYTLAVFWKRQQHEIAPFSEA